MCNKEFDWRDIDAMVRLLVRKIKDSGKQYTEILAIEHGGKIPAALLSYYLDIPVTNIPPIELDSEDNDLFKTILIVDDVCDVGQTFELITSNRKIIVDTVVLVKKNWSSYEPTFSAAELDKDEWAIFPWEQ